MLTISVRCSPKLLTSRYRFMCWWSALVLVRITLENGLIEIAPGILGVPRKEE